MVFFLRTQKNKNVAELEVWEDSDHMINHRPYIYLDQYNLIIKEMYAHLLGNHIFFSKIDSFMNDFYMLSCITKRGKSTPEDNYEESQELARKFMSVIANKYNLLLIED